MSEYELYHHGVKGQKWGVRRTAAQLGHRVAAAASKTGKVLYKGASKAGKATGKAVGKGAKIAKKAAVAKVKQVHAENKEKRYYKKLHKKKLSQMTDKEIKDLTDRVQKEATLKGAKYESRVQNARKFYQNVAKQPVNDIISKYAQAAIKDAFKDNSKNTTQGKALEDGKTKVKGHAKKLKQKAADKYRTFDIETEVITEPAPKRKKTSVVRGTANSFNNPVIIRHGR